MVPVPLDRRMSPVPQAATPIPARRRRHVSLVRCLAALACLFSPLILELNTHVAASTPRARSASITMQDAEERRVIVQLEAPAVAQAFGPGQDAEQGLALQAEASAYRMDLEAEQEAASVAVASAVAGAEVVERYQWAFNGLAVRLPDDDEAAVAALAEIPGVRAVFDEITYRPALFSSLAMVGVPAAWSALGGQAQAGAGVRIAVLDNGIDITHPMLAPNAFSYPAGFPLGDERFTTPKVIAARVYFRPTDPPLEGEGTPAPGPDSAPHGTHVAAVAAGIPVTATVNGLSLALSGVAPGAQLMNYRIFYRGERTGVEEARSTEVLKALDDAIADGADVILSSWESASPRLPFVTAEASAVQAAIDAGIVVVSAAGNQGPAYGSASTLLGGYDPTISVGAVTKSPILARNHLDVTSPGDVPAFLQNLPLGVALFGAPLEDVFGPTTFITVGEIGGGAFRLACEPLPAGILEGQIALIERGECPFADKVFYAQQAGAVAVVILNTEEAVMDFACSGEFCAPCRIGIPAVMVSQSAGERIASWRTLYPNATLQLDPRARITEVTPGVVWENSARGPAFMRYLKPDLVAPGVSVLSASRTPMRYEQMSGTSVAAAHVAGAAALVLQAHPDWGHAEVKAALMGTADTANLWVDAEATEPAGVLARGAGLLDAAAATAAPLLVDPPNIALAEIQAGQAVTVPLTVTDTRTSGAEIAYTLSASVEGMISVEMPGDVRVTPGATVTAPVRVTVSTAAGAGDATADLVLSSASGAVHVPLWAHIEPAVEAADILLIDNDFSNFDTFTDYARVITPVLEALPYSYSYWDADVRFDNPQTIPDLPTLQRYGTIIWLTGDNKSPFGTFVVDTPLTPIDLQLLADYLDGGGRLLAIGQNLAQASDVNPNPDPVFGRADLYHFYLGARWLQGNVFAPNDAAMRPRSSEIAVVGLGDSPMRQVALDLGLEGDGEGNQTTIDEIAPGGVPDGSDLDLVAPILQAVDARPIEAGYVGVIKWDDPTLEDRVQDIVYRSAYLSFGVEGVNNRDGLTSRAQLLARALDWLNDEVTVMLVPTAAGLVDLSRLEASATSSVGARITGYRWRIARGEEVLLETSSSAPVIHFAFPEAGEYTVTVEARDALGHTAVTEDVVTAVPGGGSTLAVDRTEALPGDTLEYRTVLQNTGDAATTVSLTLAVPAGTTYVSHSGAGVSFDAGTNTLAFSAELAPNTSVEVRLVVRINDDVAPGTVIAATGRYTAGSQTYERIVRTRVLLRTWFTLVANAAALP